MFEKCYGLDEQILAVLTESIINGTRLCSNAIILPKVMQSEDSPVKSTMSSIPDEIKVKEEPIESSEEEQQQQPSDLSSTIKSESPIVSKSKEIKKLHRKYSITRIFLFRIFFNLALMFTCDDCGVRFSNRSTLDAHRQHYCLKRGEARKSHSIGKDNSKH